MSNNKSGISGIAIIVFYILLGIFYWDTPMGDVLVSQYVILFFISMLIVILVGIIYSIAIEG